jgi:hypothetical protein
MPVIGPQISGSVGSLSGSGVALAVGIVASLWTGLGATLAVGDAASGAHRRQSKRRFTSSCILVTPIPLAREALGGRLEIVSAPGQGMSVHGTVPDGEHGLSRPFRCANGRDGAWRPTRRPNRVMSTVCSMPSVRGHAGPGVSLRPPG